MIFAIVSTLAAVTFVYVLIIKWKHQYWKRKGVPQLNPNLVFGDFGPVFTGTLSYKDFFLNTYREARSKGQKYVGIYAAASPQFVSIDVDLTKRILTGDFNHFTSRGTVHHKSIELTSNLLSMEGPEWKERRVKLTPLFTSGKMKVMFETVAATANHLVDAVSDMVTANKAIDCKDICARFTTDIISSVAFGLNSNSLKDPENIFSRIGKQIFKPNVFIIAMETVVPQNILATFKYQRFPNEVRKYFTNILKDNITYRKTNKFTRKDFLQLMIDERNRVDDPAKNGTKTFIDEIGIINESFTFFTAGFETSSSTMTFALLELAQHLDIQEKLRKDIEQTLEKHDGQITYDSLAEMEYLDRVVKETMRKYPVAVTLRRKCTKNYTIPDTNIVIEKGTKVHIPVIGLHMDPQFYENPEEFNPDNFLAEKIAKRPDFAYLPFGEGPRLCIGLRFGRMQAKVGLVSLLRNFRFTLHETMKPPFEADSGVRIYKLKQDLLLIASRISADE